MTEIGSSVLVGKTITNVELASDRMAIRFTVGVDSIVAKCDGDCCSKTWVETIEMPSGGLPATVLQVDDLMLPEKETEDGCIRFYGLKITTDKGELVIDYRNESNGYYGGNLSWPGEYHYGGVYGQNNSSEPWAKVEGE